MWMGACGMSVCEVGWQVYSLCVYWSGPFIHTFLLYVLLAHLQYVLYVRTYDTDDLLT